MLRGSIIIFTATLSVIFLKRKLHLFHLIGLALTITGVTVVGLASILSTETPAPKLSTLFAGDDPDETRRVILGDVLVVLSQLMSAVQMVVEEKFLKGRNLPPEFVVGCEGLFGFLMMVCIVLPTVSNIGGGEADPAPPLLDGNGIHESAADAWHLLTHSYKLFTLVSLARDEPPTHATPRARGSSPSPAPSRAGGFILDLDRFLQLLRPRRRQGPLVGPPLPRRRMPHHRRLVDRPPHVPPHLSVRRAVEAGLLADSALRLRRDGPRYLYLLPGRRPSRIHVPSTNSFEELAPRPHPPPLAHAPLQVIRIPGLYYPPAAAPAVPKEVDVEEDSQASQQWPAEPHHSPPGSQRPGGR